MYSMRLALALLLATTAGVPVSAQTDSTELSDRAPRFLLASATPGKSVPLDVQRAPVLRQRISLKLEGATLAEGLAAISRQAGLHLMYSKDIVPLEHQVHLEAKDITVAAALTEVLLDANVDVLFSNTRQAVLVRRSGGGAALPANGSIVGRVFDAKTQTALAGATVAAEGTSRSATTGNDGRYRITDVAPGTYTVRARYIGYAPGSASVTVSADQEAAADFGLQKSAQRLDEVVTTGTVVPTEVKALPTPVSIVSDADIALQQPHTLQQVLRQAVPSMVAWDLSDNPAQTAFSARGSSTIGGGGGGQMKVFVDGIPVADYGNAAVDPMSIERVEVIRGPQASAIYGSDANGGVIQIFTKHGDSTLTRPECDGQASVGIVQTPYAGYSSVARQTYRGSVSGGGAGLGYHFGAGYSHTPDWIEPVTAQGTLGVDGSLSFARNIVSGTVSGRYFVVNQGLAIDPALFQTGALIWKAPYFRASQYALQTIGAHLTVAPTTWWHNDITVGMDHKEVSTKQVQPRLRFPGDTLFIVAKSLDRRDYIAFNSSVQGALSPTIKASLTVGVDHFKQPSNFWETLDAVSPGPPLQIDPSGSVFADYTAVNDNGYFGQGQLAISDMLFLTGGIRAEQNSSFGTQVKTPWSPQFGITYVRPIGGATLKVRGSWGRAIRPPEALAAVTQDGQLPNLLLRPERQKGWDTGVDAVFGERGSLSVTYFHQVAEDLIEAVIADTSFNSINVNVGRVTNEGIELEGTIALGPVQAHAQYGYVKSRIRDLGPGYVGDLQVGDQLLAIPTHTAGGMVSFAPSRGTTLAAGVTYVGDWLAYDILAEARCIGGTAPCRAGPGFRNYIITHPGITRVNLTASQRLTSLVSGVVSVDNLTNNTGSEFVFTGATMGRITSVGLQFHY